MAGWLHTEINVRHRELNPDTVTHLESRILYEASLLVRICRWLDLESRHCGRIWSTLVDYCKCSLPFCASYIQWRNNDHWKQYTHFYNNKNIILYHIILPYYYEANIMMIVAYEHGPQNRMEYFVSSLSPSCSFPFYLDAN